MQKWDDYASTVRELSPQGSSHAAKESLLSKPKVPSTNEYGFRVGALLPIQPGGLGQRNFLTRYDSVVRSACRKDVPGSVMPDRAFSSRHVRS
jgi:hypothetical protein